MQAHEYAKLFPSLTPAASAMGVKPRRVQQAKKVKRQAPDLHEKVKVT